MTFPYTGVASSQDTNPPRQYDDERKQLNLMIPCLLELVTT